MKSITEPIKLLNQIRDEEIIILSKADVIALRQGTRLIVAGHNIDEIPQASRHSIINLHNILDK